MAEFEPAPPISTAQGVAVPRRRARHRTPTRPGRSVTVAVLDGAGVMLFDVASTADGVRTTLRGREAAAGPEVAGLVSAFDKLLVAERPRRLEVLLLAPPASIGLHHLPVVGSRRLGRLVSTRQAGEDQQVHAWRVLGPSYQDRRQGLAVASASAPAELLDGLYLSARQRRVALTSVRTRPAGGVALLDLFAAEEVESSGLLIEVSRRGLRFTVVEGGEARFSRGVNLGERNDPAGLPARVVTETQRTNLYLQARFHARPPERILLVGNEAELLDAVTEHLEERLELPVRAVTTDLRVVGSDDPRVQDLAPDLAASLTDCDAAALGSFSLVSPRARQRRVLMVVLPLLILLGLWCAHLLERRHAILAATIAEQRQVLASLSVARAALPSRVADLQRAGARRADLQQQIAELAGLAPLQVPAAEVIEDVLGRIPRDVVVDLIRIQPDGSARLLVLEGFGLYDLASGPARNHALVEALGRSPFLSAVEHDSGRFDPFALVQAGQPILYPVYVTAVVGGTP